MKYNNTSLYVHLPFCKHICSYCDFVKFIYNQERVNKYLVSLFKQIEELNDKQYLSIFLGGGTPSSLDLESLDNLLSKLEAKLANQYIEFTIECNVEDINVNFLKIIKKHKVNRLSIGAQSFLKKNIDFCERKHNKKEAKKKIKLACKYIKNCSIDMIFGFPNQSVFDLICDILTAVFLPVKHISYYSLQIEEGTKIYTKKIKEIDNDLSARMYKIIYYLLNLFGYKRYEISNFSLFNKYQSYHNKVYWKNQKYDAIGLSASGYIDNIRYKNNDNIIKYMNFDYSLIEEVKLSKEDIIFDEIMLGFRLSKGINTLEFKEKYNIDFCEKYQDILNICYKEKLLKRKKEYIKTTLKGSMILNDVLEMFLS